MPVLGDAGAVRRIHELVGAPDEHQEAERDAQGEEGERLEA
jgi:hypothetical protein